MWGAQTPEKRVHSIPTSRVTLQFYIQHSRFALDMIPPLKSPNSRFACLLLFAAGEIRVCYLQPARIGTVDVRT